MAHHTTLKGGRSSRRAATVLAGVAASGAVAVAAGLGSAPTANATCVSIFGIGNGGGCTSNLFSAAIAIGTGATATAHGLFGAAFSIGTGAIAGTSDAFTFATAVGSGSTATATGLFGIAAQLGQNGTAETTGSGQLGNIGLNIAIGVTPGSTGADSTRADGLGNIALSLLPTTASNYSAGATGLGNLAVDLFGSGGAQQSKGDGNVTLNVGAAGALDAEGVLNNATSLFSTTSQVGALTISPIGPAFASWAFNVFGHGNFVRAGAGPFAVAGSIGQTGQSITKSGPGFNINGIKVFGAAAVKPTTTATAATAVRNGTKTATPSAANVGHSKR